MKALDLYANLPSASPVVRQIFASVLAMRRPVLPSDSFMTSLPRLYRLDQYMHLRRLRSGVSGECTRMADLQQIRCPVPAADPEIFWQTYDRSNVKYSGRPRDTKWQTEMADRNGRPKWQTEVADLWQTSKPRMSPSDRGIRCDLVMRQFTALFPPFHPRAI